jgi:hypothetical protein
MGMFDYLEVQQKIPGYAGIPDEEFQTKSFENLMDKYIITVKGHLYRERWQYEWVEEPEHFLKGYIRKIEGSLTREYLTDFHGDIIFYTSKPITENRVWRDYTARFTEGRLARIWYEDKQY